MSGDLALMPWRVLRVPSLKLRLPKLRLPAASTVFWVVLAIYFFVLSGIVYDVVMEPPSIGSTQDERGRMKPVVFLMYRINGQYIIEGLSAGALYVIGCVGFIMLLSANQKFLSDVHRQVLLVGGGLAVVISFMLLQVFIRMKVPGYGQWNS